MSKRALLLFLAVMLPAAFLAGWLASRGSGGGSRGGGARTVLYWVDPMNPSFRSPEPGTAPCGMPLEPVYSDSPGLGGDAMTGPPGAVSVRADRLQLVGVAVETVRSGAARHTLRLLGRVTADERRLYRISAVTSGWVREMGEATTGSLVAKSEVLASYYTPEIVVPQQTYIYALDAYDKLRTTGSNPHDNMQGGGQLQVYDRNVRTARQALLNLGMSAEQLDEVAMNRRVEYLLQVRAPATGFVLARNVSSGEQFEAGKELYSIADLRRVWVLADAFEGEDRFFAPGTVATVRNPGLGIALPGRVSSVLPQFESASRTLKIRFETDNPGFVLRPDMFVDVELPVETAAAIFVPKEAVLDSGTRRVVFVEQGEGLFESRRVETGRRIGDKVEILAGLMDGDRVVTSGNFLLDSESRMRASGVAGSGVGLDPVCGMEVDEDKARAAGLTVEHGGVPSFFCAPVCMEKFKRDPAAYAGRKRGPAETGRAAEAAPAAVPPGRTPHAASRDQGGAATDPVCGLAVHPATAAALGLTAAHGGETWYFCSHVCRDTFMKNPAGVIGEEKKPTPGGMMPGTGHQMRAPQGESAPAPAAPPGAGSSANPGGADWNLSSKRPTQMHTDPVCGMEVDEEAARRDGLYDIHDRIAYFFCSTDCMRIFRKDPVAALERETDPMSAMGRDSKDGGQREGMSEAPLDPVCGMEVDLAAARVVGLESRHEGKTWHFCSPQCKKEFDAAPSKFAKPTR